MPPGYPTMQRARDIELNFPIKDATSASLMLIKADCLHKAGVINEAEKQWVNYKARSYLDDATLPRAGRQVLASDGAVFGQLQ